MPRAEVKPPYTAPLLIVTVQPTSTGLAAVGAPTAAASTQPYTPLPSSLIQWKGCFASSAVAVTLHLLAPRVLVAAVAVDEAYTFPPAKWTISPFSILPPVEGFVGEGFTSASYSFFMAAIKSFHPFFRARMIWGQFLPFQS